MDWELYKLGDDSIDILKAFEDIASKNSKLHNFINGWNYINNVQSLSAISSQQVAAVIIINSLEMSK